MASGAAEHNTVLNKSAWLQLCFFRHARRAQVRQMGTEITKKSRLVWYQGTIVSLGKLTCTVSMFEGTC